MTKRAQSRYKPELRIGARPPRPPQRSCRFPIVPNFLLIVIHILPPGGVWQKWQWMNTGTCPTTWHGLCHSNLSTLQSDMSVMSWWTLQVHTSFTLYFLFKWLSSFRMDWNLSRLTVRCSIVMFVKITILNLMLFIYHCALKNQHKNNCDLRKRPHFGWRGLQIG